MQQLFLRWNQGQDLRQALITIAISIILADQMLAHFGGVAEDIAWPRDVRQVRQSPGCRDPVHADAARHPRHRGRRSASLLWLWLKRTRTGMVIRAGVDDRAMVSALGINIQLTFAIAFAVGSALAGLGGVIGGSFASLAPGVDANWLLYSLVVVIIGGMGSLGGAAIGSLLLGLTTNFSAAYLPVELHVLLDHLHVRARRDRARRPAARPVREAGVSRVTPDRVVGVPARWLLAVIAPLRSSRPTGSATLLTQMLFLGIVAASLIFLSAYGGMVSLAQVAIYGIAGFVARQRDDERQHEGPQSRLEPVARGRRRHRRRRGGRAALRRAREPQRRDLLPDDHADVLGDREPVLRPGDRRLGLRRHQRHPGAGRHRPVDAHQNRLYYIALVVALASTPCSATSCARRSG